MSDSHANTKQEKKSVPFLVTPVQVESILDMIRDGDIPRHKVDEALLIYLVRRSDGRSHSEIWDELTVLYFPYKKQ